MWKILVRSALLLTMCISLAQGQADGSGYEGNDVVAIPETSPVDNTITNLAEVDWKYHLAVNDSTIAIIEQDRKTLNIYRPGNDPIAVSAKVGWLFFTVSFVSPDMILTGEFSETISGGFRWTGRDRNGEVVSGPVFSASTLTMSPDGRFYYSLNDPGSEDSHPMLYDDQGEVINRFNPPSGDWDLRFISGVGLFYREAGKVSVHSLPDLLEKTACPSIDIVPFFQMPSSLSGDAAYYTLVTKDKVVVWNLKTCQTTSIDIFACAERVPLSYALVSDSGMVVMLQVIPQEGYQVSFCSEPASSSVSGSRKLRIPVDESFHFDTELSCVNNRHCVFNFWKTEESSFMYRSVLVSIIPSKTADEQMQVFDGLVLPGMTPTEFKVVSLSGHTARFTSFIAVTADR